MNLSVGLVLAAVLCLAGGTPACAQKNPFATTAQPMRLPPPDPNAPRWHTIKVPPKPGLPKIHFYDKLNLIWWFGNCIEPTPPAWYEPNGRFRTTKWYFRNPLSNFTWFVIGVADKNFSRSGKFPERNSDPRGGWNFAVTRRHVVLLPYFCYERKWCTFYLGWRERGNFGIKVNIHGRKPENKPAIRPDLPKPAESSLPIPDSPGDMP